MNTLLTNLTADTSSIMAAAVAVCKKWHRKGTLTLKLDAQLNEVLAIETKSATFTTPSINDLVSLSGYDIKAVAEFLAQNALISQSRSLVFYQA